MKILSPGEKLIPNEIIGYRLVPDEHNWVVVRVKRHGPASAKAGQEYTEDMQYHQTLRNAVDKVLEYTLRTFGAQSQATTDTIASMDALLESHARVEASVLDAVARLQGLLETKAPPKTVLSA